jgi:hypothetical protein
VLNVVNTMVKGRSLSGLQAGSASALKPPFDGVTNGKLFTTIATGYGISENDFNDVMDFSVRARDVVFESLSSRFPCVAAGVTQTCITQVVSELLPLAYRRPVTSADVDQIMAATKGGTGTDVLRLALQRILLSPQFLFRVEANLKDANQQFQLTLFQVAEMMSFLFTEGPPDQPLWDDAVSGQLAREDIIRKHVVRLLETKQGELRAGQFYLEWFGYEKARAVRPANHGIKDLRPEGLASDAERFAGFVSRRSRNNDALNELYLSDHVFPSKNSAPVYGMEPAGVIDGTGYAQATTRSGFLTQPAWLMANSYEDEPHPIRRGHFVTEYLLCGVIQPAPIGVVAILPKDPTKTMRERLAMHSVGGCVGCHQYMDDIGLGLEGFDHIGRVRTMEIGKPVDVSGVLRGSSNEDGAFSGALELSKKLARSVAARQCFVKKIYEFSAGKELNTVTQNCSLGRIDDAFVKEGRTLESLYTAFFSEQVSGARENK